MPDRRTRRKRSPFTYDKAEVVDRVIDFYTRDLMDTQTERDLRLQRYAKLRMWTEEKDWPWENASNIGLPDMMEKSLRMQDTLHNAVVTQRPAIGATAFKKGDRNKEQTVDRLIDFQVFEEQRGEEAVGELADAFLNDGVFTAFIPWIKEKRETRDSIMYPPIPGDLLPIDYFSGLLRQRWPEHRIEPKNDGWDWAVLGEEKFEVRFYAPTETSEVEMVIIEDVIVYDGPCIIVKDFEDVLHPPRSGNLQIPGPSNPRGASHVILRDYPTIDEIKRLNKSKYYDISKEDLDSLENVGLPQDDEEKIQKDDLQGVQNNREKVRSHRTVTRLMCFDMFDIDGDGIDEDVIWWIALETRTLLKVAVLTELFPAVPPRRPLAEASFLPIRGRRAGISIPELLESLHDVQKQLFDQTVDNGTIRNAPFFFYRATSAMKQGVIRLWPGEGYPVADPQKDVNFPQFGNPGSDAFGLNMLAVLSNMEGKLTLVDDLQLGRVPAGKSSALRTVGGMALLAAQGEARPERILRRFFSGLSEIWRQIHELNQRFLPKDKQIRIFDLKKPSEEPYQTITDKSRIRGRFQFSFSANALNTSKQAMQDGLGALMGVYITPLALQMGLIDEAGAYRLLRDYGKAWGQDPDQYLNEPSPGAMLPKITAEEAYSQIMNGQVPHGMPLEGFAGHLQGLEKIMKDKMLFGMLTPERVEIFGGYVKIVQNRMREEEQRQRAIMQAAQQFNQGQNQGNGGRPPETIQNSSGQPPVQQNELLDESLPTAGGGGV